MVVLLRAVRRRPWRSAVAVRWAIGVRVLLPVACGAAHLRVATYLVGTAISSLTWSAAFVALGFAFGDAAVTVLAAIRRYDQWVVVAVALIVALGWSVHRWRKRKVESAAAKLDTTDVPELADDAARGGDDARNAP
jgi:membrane protein DedA with SNARE-associated domain